MMLKTNTWNQYLFKKKNLALFVENFQPLNTGNYFGKTKNSCFPGRLFLKVKSLISSQEQINTPGKFCLFKQIENQIENLH